jgi:hypothetical protein
MNHDRFDLARQGPGMVRPPEQPVREKIAEPIEQLEALDAVLEPLQKAVQTVVPQRSKLKDVLSDTWLSEPLHPPLTDVVIGTWTSALLLLDLLGGEQAHKAADGLVGVGVLAAVPTVTAGLSDWAELSGGSRRAGGAGHPGEVPMAAAPRGQRPDVGARGHRGDHRAGRGGARGLAVGALRPVLRDLKRIPQAA